MSSRPRSSRGFEQAPKREGYSQGAFFTMLIFTIIVGIIIVVVLYLYFRQDGSRIDPNECPEALTGILINPDKRVATVATNCGTNLNCTYTVQTVAEAVAICNDLGSNKCAAFSLQQIPLTDDFDLVISESTDTIDVV